MVERACDLRHAVSPAAHPGSQFLSGTKARSTAIPHVAGLPSIGASGPVGYLASTTAKTHKDDNKAERLSTLMIQEMEA